MRAIVIIPFRGDPETLRWVLDGLAGQKHEPGLEVEVRIGGDGCVVPPPPADIGAVRFVTACFDRVGISEAKNRLLANVSGDDVVIFVNGDTRPAPDFVQVHVRRLLSLPAGSMVLGASPYVEPGPERVFDVLRRDMPLIFFYANMQPGGWYDYRHAWNMNVSVRGADVLRAGGFSAALRPVFYDDIEMAFRVMGTEKRVYFEPGAVVEHRHPMRFEGYLMREELLGLMAPVLARVNPAMFAALFGGRSVAELAQDFRVWVRMDGPGHAWIWKRMGEWVDLPAASLGQGETRQRLLGTIYQMHVPLKRLAFRLGFLRGVELADDARWQERNPTGLWKQVVEAQG